MALSWSPHGSYLEIRTDKSFTTIRLMLSVRGRTKGTVHAPFYAYFILLLTLRSPRETKNVLELGKGSRDFQVSTNPARARPHCPVNCTVLYNIIISRFLVDILKYRDKLNDYITENISPLTNLNDAPNTRVYMISAILIKKNFFSVWNHQPWKNFYTQKMITIDISMFNVR